MRLLGREVTVRYFFTVSAFALQTPDPHGGNQNVSRNGELLGGRVSLDTPMGQAAGHAVLS